MFTVYNIASTYTFLLLSILKDAEVPVTNDVFFLVLVFLPLFFIGIRLGCMSPSINSIVEALYGARCRLSTFRPSTVWWSVSYS